MSLMYALVKKETRQGLWLEQVPVPEPDINDVKIRINKTAICGTDMHIYNWDEWSQKTIPVPMVVGHEFVGEIVAVGKNVKKIASSFPDECILVSIQRAGVVFIPHGNTIFEQVDHITSFVLSDHLEVLIHNLVSGADQPKHQP